MEQQFFSRYDDPTPVKCEECGWIGQMKDTVHAYHEIPYMSPDGEYDPDVEPADECPKCGSDNLYEQRNGEIHA